MQEDREYYAFISYKREDEKWAKWLQRKLEHYRMPSRLSGRENLPKAIRPIFRDTTEMAPGNLAKQIHGALENSQYLIVICSPRAATSPWVNKEIESFMASRGADRIIPFIVDGKVHAAVSSEECYPKSLKDMEGESELLGANINEMGRDAAAVKVVATMFGLKFDSLWRRYERDLRRKRHIIAAVMALVVVVTLSVAGFISFQNSRLRESNWNLLRNESLYLAKSAEILSDKGDGYTAASLILGALPQNLSNPDRPYTVEAEIALRKALSSNARLYGERNGINDVAVSPDGAMVVSASNDEDAPLKVWALHSGELLYELPADFESATSAVFACGGSRLVAAGGWGSCIQVWDVNKMEKSFGLFSLEGDILSMDANPSGTNVAIALWNIQNEEGSIKEYDAESGDEIRTLQRSRERIVSLSYSYDGRYLASCSKKEIRIWAMEEGKVVKTFHSKESGFITIAISPDSKFLAAGCRDDIIQVWDVDSGKLLFRLETGASNSHGVTGLTFSRDGTMLAASYYSGTRVWNTEDGSELYQETGVASESVCFTPDGRQIITVAPDYTLHVINIIHANLLLTMKDPDRLPNKYSGHEARGVVSFSPDGKYILSCSGSKIVQRGTLSGGIVSTCVGHTGEIRSVSYCDNGNLIVSYADDKTIRIWDSSTGEGLNSPIVCNDVAAVACTSHGSTIAAVTTDGVLSLYDAKDGSLLSSFRIDIIEYANSIAFSQDGKQLVIGDNNGAIIVDVESQRTNPLLLDYRGWYNVYCVAYSPDGKTVATNGTIWDVIPEDPECSFELSSGNVISNAFSPDGKRIVTGETNGAITIWDVGTGQRVITLSEVGSPVTGVAFSPDGTSVVSMSRDNTIKIWSFPNTQSLIESSRERFRNNPVSESVFFDAMRRG